MRKNKVPVAINGSHEISLFLNRANRHGLITGATGTGKTVTLQTLTEAFSDAGVPVFAADMKGDLSGVAKAGGGNKHVIRRVEQYDLANKGFTYKAFPVCFWDVFNEQGHSIQTTITNMGPLLLERLLNLNETQGGILSVLFRIARDEDIVLDDLDDLQQILRHVGKNRNYYSLQYGNITLSSLGAIQRNLIRLENEGADKLFGKPALNILDFIKVEQGRGLINILAADKLMRSPRVYTAFLLWLLDTLYDTLPEVGDLDKPKLVFFFDEAHLLFSDITKTLLIKIEQTVRLIRSKGVGVYFVTQNPTDIPRSILGQLGNRIQHALRAYTLADQKAVRAAANTFRANSAFNTENVISNLSVGEALISFLDERSIPQIVERAYILPPQGQIGPITEDERKQLIRDSRYYGVYKPVIKVKKPVFVEEVEEAPSIQQLISANMRANMFKTIFGNHEKNQ